MLEQNPLYCAWAEKRLELAEMDREIQGYSDGVFWERVAVKTYSKLSDSGYNVRPFFAF